MKRSVLTMLTFASCLAAASCQSSEGVTQPCDLLVRLDPTPATNSYIVANDRGFAVRVAQHRGRVAHYGCR